MPLRLRLLPSPAPTTAAARVPTAERTIDLPDDALEIRIGRRPDLEVPLPYPALSALHARLFRDDAGWQLEDLGSTNGTRLDGQRLTPHRPRAVSPGAQMVLGQVTLIFDGAVTTAVGAERTATIAKRLVSDLFAASPDLATPTLAIADGVRPRPPLRLEKTDHRYVAGRAASCDLHLRSEEISREHLEIVRLWDGVVVSDLGSKNGVRVNDVLLIGRQKLRDGDLVQVGPAVLRLSDPADRYLRDFEARTDRREAQGAVEGPAAAIETEPVTSSEAAPTASVAEPPAVATEPEVPPARGSRTAIVVAAAVLIGVAAVAVALAFGG